MHSVTVIGTAHKNSFGVYCIEDTDYKMTFAWDPKYDGYVDNLENKYLKVVGCISESYDDGTIILEVDSIEQLEPVEE